MRRYVDRGLVVTVNTDDPQMFGNSLADEFRILHARFDFSQPEIRRLIVQGIQASWLPAERKHEFINAFQADPAW